MAGHPSNPDQCVVDKIEQFRAELANPAVPAAERIQALKFLIHLVGDLHQPLHAVSNDDRGGNCVTVRGGAAGSGRALHSYWDTAVVRLMKGTDSVSATAARLGQSMPADADAWAAKSSQDWAYGSYRLAHDHAYRLQATLPHCGDEGPAIRLPRGYEATARTDVARQLQLGGAALAKLLNDALA